VLPGGKRIKGSSFSFIGKYFRRGNYDISQTGWGKKGADIWRFSGICEGKRAADFPLLGLGYQEIQRVRGR